MCGQVGMIFGWKRRTRNELDYFRKVFTYLLLLSEERGPHATGVAWLKRDGTHRILKQPRKASDFFRDAAFRSFIASVGTGVTWLAGHTRWQTVGDASNNSNNHPIIAGEIIGTHNGTIVNADALFTRFGLPRSAEVDSELIFQMADATLSHGCIDIAEFKAKLALCRGGISAVMASKRSPREVVIIKGNKPLEIRYSELFEAIVYASDARYLDMVLTRDRSWRSIDLEPMTIATLSCDSLQVPICEPFEIAGSIDTDRFLRWR